MSDRTGQPVRIEGGAPADEATPLPSAIVPLLGFQKRDVESEARFCWSCWSRQTGKSFAKSLKRVIRALRRKRLQVLLSAGERQSKELMMKVQQHVRALNVAAQYRDDQYFEDTSYRLLELILPDGVRIIALPANPDTARGFTGDALLDEFGVHKNSRGIWGALFPTVTRGKGEIDISSTPKGLDNVFAEQRNNDMFERTTVTIYDAVADGLEVDPEELRKALNDDELWRQEFCCEFLDEAAALLTYEAISGCVFDSLPAPVRTAGEDITAGLEAIEGLKIASIARLIGRLAREEDARVGPRFLGVDVGRRKDLTVFWLVRRDGSRLVTDLVIECRNTPFRRQWELLCAFRELGFARKISIDATGLGMQLAEMASDHFGEWVVDQVTFTQTVKEKLAGQLHVRVQDKSILIPHDEQIRNDWHSIQKIVTTGGTVRYQAERTPDGHADRFWAAALAVDAASTGEGAWNGEGIVGSGARRLGVRPAKAGRDHEREGRAAFGGMKLSARGSLMRI